MENIVNAEPLSEDNQNHFQKIWRWFVNNKITTKEAPQVTKDEGSYHIDGLIGIDIDVSRA